MLPATSADRAGAEGGALRSELIDAAIGVSRSLRIDLVALRDLCALTAVAAAVRIALIHARSMWFDEVFSVEIARLPVTQGIALLRTDAHPPLYYLILHAWLRLGDSPTAVRSLSLLFGVVTVALTYLFARRIGGRSLGLAAGLLMAVSALAVHASVEARMYAPLACVALAATWALREAAARPEPARWILYAGALIVALYLDYLAFLLFPVHLAYVAWATRARPRGFTGFALAVGAALLAYGPWWPVLADQLRTGHLATFWKGRMPVSAPFDSVALAAFGGRVLGLGDYLVGTGRVTVWQALLLLPFVALVMLGSRRLRHRADGALLLASWALPLIILVIVSLATGIHYAIPRYASFVQPFFIVLVSSGMLRLPRLRVGGWLPVLLLAGVAVLNLTVLGAAARASQPFDWAAAARHVDQRWREGDGIVFYPHTGRLAFGYYFRHSRAPALTLYPPSQPRGGGALDTERAIPDIPALLPSARRVWLVLTVPTPEGSTEALLAAMGRWYERRQSADFHYVWIVLFEKPR